MNVSAKFFVEWICPVCKHINKKRIYSTIHCSKCSFTIDVLFFNHNYVICNKQLVKKWKELKK